MDTVAEIMSAAPAGMAEPTPRTNRWVSIAGMNWLAVAPVHGDQFQTLFAIAKHLDAHGKGSFLSIATMAEISGNSVSKVATDIKKLKAQGLIVEGDQSLTRHLPVGQRPKVYDAVLSMVGPKPRRQSKNPSGKPRSRTPSVAPEKGGTPSLEAGGTKQTKTEGTPSLKGGGTPSLQGGGTPSLEAIQRRNLNKEKSRLSLSASNSLPAREAEDQIRDAPSMNSQSSHLTPAEIVGPYLLEGEDPLEIVTEIVAVHLRPEDKPREWFSQRAGSDVLADRIGEARKGASDRRRSSIGLQDARLAAAIARKRLEAASAVGGGRAAAVDG